MTIEKGSFQEGSVTQEMERRMAIIEAVIGTYTPSGHERKLASMIHRELSSQGLTPKIDRAGNVICEAGTGSTSLLFCGHMDTVPGDLKVRDEEGYIYGRGACDAKGPLLSLLFAFEDLARDGKLEGKLIFAGVTDEEQDSKGLNEMVRSKIKADYAIFGEPGGSSKITIGYRGHISTRIQVVTAEVHASAPRLTTNSAELAFEIYSGIKKEFNVSSDQSTDHVSVAITEIRAGTAHNVIPGKTNMTIDIRLPIGHDSDRARDLVTKTVDIFRHKNEGAMIALTFDAPTEPYKVRMDSPLVRAMNRAILGTGEKPALVMKSGTGDMNTYALTFSVDAITYGPGDARLSHTSDEKVEIEEIFRCSSVLQSAARELFRMKNRLPQKQVAESKEELA